MIHCLFITLTAKRVIKKYVNSTAVVPTTGLIFHSEIKFNNFRHLYVDVYAAFQY